MRIEMQYLGVGINVDVDQGTQATLHAAFLNTPITEECSRDRSCEVHLCTAREEECPDSLL